MLETKTLRSVNANAPGYWQTVRRNVKLNKALGIAGERFDKIHMGQVYEAWLERVSRMVRSVAIECELLADDDYREFRERAADKFGLPELCGQEEDILSMASDVLREAQEFLFGQMTDTPQPQPF